MAAGAIHKIIHSSRRREHPRWAVSNVWWGRGTRSTAWITCGRITGSSPKPMGLKYPGSDPADVITAEKERKRYLRRELGLDE